MTEQIRYQLIQFTEGDSLANITWTFDTWEEAADQAIKSGLAVWKTKHELILDERQAKIRPVRE